MPEPSADITVPHAGGTGPGTSPPRPEAWRRLPRIDSRELAAIFAGGALGTLLRAALGEAFPGPATPLVRGRGAACRRLARELS